MNVVALLAGGTGQRLGAAVPKQFVKVFGKPLMVYALEIYEKSPLIDAIEVVCIPEYMEEVRQYVHEYHITKLKWVVPGGDSCQDSTRNGIFGLEGICADNDMLIFNMSTSVFVSEEIIADSLKVCRERGNAFAAMQCIYNNAETFDGISAKNIHSKETHRTLNLPWTAPFKTFDVLYRKAYARGIETSAASYAPTLFLAMGETLYLSKNTAKNKIHVSTQDDLDIITACLDFERKKKLYHPCLTPCWPVREVPASQCFRAFHVKGCAVLCED
ncbi:2-C-methyl-D-erythritol 4-phosphate cytidylyltransferase [Pseudoflavonifractor sp. 524-17]|uniref:IspD/TarI family cytidylyltransferase n=1 Tax=Pseudoflavonifractor sp. 524-17 TaxID=2304577 RepID=UPI00137B35CD|nr:2-C-methyl-D-erythritol 4-phosphate cytidylyltransferase [Pseudoflavonifractor sp. 524-17]NCE66401.1 2-C-methyl-D-erythritol 4-phosphate cytidylyltransferase [Pseudoflavonifractor sp. 524-17]